VREGGREREREGERGACDYVSSSATHTFINDADIKTDFGLIQ